MFYNRQISDNQKIKVSGKRVKVIDVHRPENPHYVFATVVIKGQSKRPGRVTFKLGRKPLGEFRVLPKTPHPETAFKGVDASDLMYLIMPDRFANGDTSNDVVTGTMEAVADRAVPKARHGGDLSGIRNNIPYLKELGVSAVWLNPFLENDQSVESYHGYAFTNHYHVDPRLGGLSDILELSASLRDSRIKLIMDVVYNHIGNQHFLYQDKPEDGWFNEFDTFYRTNYRATALMDPYASNVDRVKMTDGAFDHTMPDLNQRNVRVARYLKQYTIWWVRTLGLNGLRIDTYAYSDQKFMRSLVRTVYNDILPMDSSFHIFAETWVHGHAVQSHFSKDYGSLPKPLYLTDFQWYFAVKKALSTPFGWTEGLSALYYTLAKDGDYPDPKGHVTFLDNHDLDRFYGVIGQDDDKWKVGMGLLMTGRGIPCLLYGSEILMPEGGDHGILRKDMPGGWPGDTISVFSHLGRTTAEQRGIEYVQSLANLRATGIFSGKLTQFVPENGIYVYAWQKDGKTLLCVVNQQDAPALVRTERYAELLKGKNRLVEAINAEGKVVQLPASTLEIPAVSFTAFWVD
jgi:glycosidase